MKPIIVIDLPLGMGIDREITEPYGYDLFYGDENIEAQWKKTLHGPLAMGVKVDVLKFFRI